MTTMTPGQARIALAEAEQEKAEAEDLAAALAEQVRAGDTTVTPAQIAEQKQLAEFAGLRIAAARRKLTAAEDTDRHARARAVVDDVTAMVDNDDPGELTAAVRTAAVAVRALADLGGARQDRMRRLTREVHAIDYELQQALPDGAARYRLMREQYGVAADEHGRRIAVYNPRRAASTATVAELLAAAVALGTPNIDDVQQLHQVLEGADAGTGRAFAAVPTLADDWRLSPEEWQALPQGERQRAHRLRLAPARDDGPEAA